MRLKKIVLTVAISVATLIGSIIPVSANVTTQPKDNSLIDSTTFQSLKIDPVVSLDIVDANG